MKLVRSFLCLVFLISCSSAFTDATAEENKIKITAVQKIDDGHDLFLVLPATIVYPTSNIQIGIVEKQKGIGKPNNPLIKYSDVKIVCLDQEGNPIELGPDTSPYYTEVGGWGGMTACGSYKLKLKPGQTIDSVKFIWNAKETIIDHTKIEKAIIPK